MAQCAIVPYSGFINPRQDGIHKWMYISIYLNVCLKTTYRSWYRYSIQHPAPISVDLWLTWLANRLKKISYTQYNFSGDPWVSQWAGDCWELGRLDVVSLVDGSGCGGIVVEIVAQSRDIAACFNFLVTLFDISRRHTLPLLLLLFLFCVMEVCSFFVLKKYGWNYEKCFNW